ncbi:hypothetical protein [Acinetobacter baumannii]|uniref:Uncharacterized protein n=2 Tax=Acinetobacter baumannii TaxID=470 RepID=A0A241ZHU6_ACIBA|nr:hypothetical protein [Acinetobacter baumannii]EXB40020.1 hypothetical protein J540_3701 [Acinetobacter baumannii 1440422]KCY49108.1 hypothetical protein J715_2030 [Acinetobacter baumannii 1571545]AUT40087.1 hypothetical protein C2U32_19180 [Acinetobacter baumannii]EHU3230054.1 hypothetical protein [Acinetobacter baumannii]EHZ7614041.1 hypothetical protein [Acinetobacter baumannii]
MAVLHQLNNHLCSLRRWQDILKGLLLLGLAAAALASAYSFYKAFFELKDYLLSTLYFFIGFANFCYFLKYRKYKVKITYRFNVYCEDMEEYFECSFIGENFEKSLIMAYEKELEGVKYSSFDNVVLNILVQNNKIPYKGGADAVFVRRKLNGLKLFKMD